MKKMINRTSTVLVVLLFAFPHFVEMLGAQIVGPESFQERSQRLLHDGDLYEARQHLEKEYLSVLSLEEADPYRRAVVANYLLSTTYRKDLVGRARRQFADLAEYPDLLGARARLNLSALQDDSAVAWRTARRAVDELVARQATPEMVALAEIWVITYVDYEVEVKAVFDGDASRLIHPQTEWVVEYPEATRRAAADLHRHLAIIESVKSANQEMYEQAERLCRSVEATVKKKVSRKRDRAFHELLERLRNQEYHAALSAARGWRARHPETIVTLSRGEGAYAYHASGCETIMNSRVFRVKERVAISRYDRIRCSVCRPQQSWALPVELRRWRFDGEEYLLLPFLKDEQSLARFFSPGPLIVPIQIDAFGREPQLRLPLE